MAHLERAVGLDPGDRESSTLLSLLRPDPGGPAETGGLARVLSDDTFATLSFAAVCLEQGLADEAAQVFLRILRKDAGNERARAGLEEALRAKIQRRKGP